MKTLIVVDVQNDFINPVWGHLYVNKGEEVVQNIIDYIKDNVNELREVVFTLDWHPNVDSVFTEPNITWPKHCLQFSEGAAIPQVLIDTCVDNHINMKFFIKGNDTYKDPTHTEYGAFDDIGKWGIYNGEKLFKVNNRLQDSPLWLYPDDEFVVCGVAGDYCVMNTIKNLQKYEHENQGLKISILKSGIRSIDDGTTLNEFIQKNNFDIYG